MLTHADRQTLIAKRHRLQARLTAIKQDFRRGLDADSSERAVELENAETLNEILRVTKTELAQVEAILAESAV